MRRSLVAAAATAIFVSETTWSATENTSYLPAAGEYVARDMQVVAPQELVILGGRISDAVKRNPVWFQGYVSKHAKVSPLPYSSEFGITEEEYKRFLTLGKAQSALQEVGRAPLILTKSGTKIVFSSTSSSGALSGVSVDTLGRWVDTPYGRLSRSTRIDQQDPDAPTGRWSGMQWSNGEPDGANQTAKFALGLTSSGDRILYFNVLVPEARRTLILLYK